MTLRIGPIANKKTVGDPLVKSASFDVAGMDEGDTLRAVQSSVPDGAGRKGGEIRITATVGADSC